MKIFCCQHDIEWENKPANFARVHKLLAGAQFPKGSLVLLPEMFATGFSMAAQKIAEKPGGETDQFLSTTARELGIYLLAGVVGLGADGRARNQSVVFNPEGHESARYSKIQPFAPGGEAANYAAGDTPVLFDWQGVRVALFVCYDLRFPEIFRVAARQHPQLYTVISSWPDARLAHWVRLLQARAIENQAWVAGVNRVGSDPNFHYSGRSLIANHHGEILADAGDQQTIINVELDIAALEQYRADRPFLADMRPDFVKGV